MDRSSLWPVTSRSDDERLDAVVEEVVVVVVAVVKLRAEVAEGAPTLLDDRPRPVLLSLSRIEFRDDDGPSTESLATLLGSFERFISSVAFSTSSKLTP